VASPFVLIDLLRDSIQFFQHFRHHHNFSNCQDLQASYKKFNGSDNYCSLSSISSQNSVARQPSIFANSPVCTNNQPNPGKSSSAQAKTLMLQNGHSQTVAEMMRHCVEMCYAAACNKLNYSNFSEQDLDYVCDLVVVSRDAYSILPQHQRAMFDTFLQYVKKQKACKREVYQSIIAALHSRQIIDVGGQN